MLLITFASHEEARASIHLLKAIQLEKTNLYKFERGNILVTGMGSIAAAATTMPYLNTTTEIWNYGLAGSLKEGLTIGSLHPIQTASKWLHFPHKLDEHSKNFGSKIHPTFANQQHGLHLISSDYPIHAKSLRQRMSLNYDLVDMEGYGIAFAATACKVPYSLWKIVSDFASHEGPDLIKKHIAHHSELMAQAIEFQMKAYT